MDLARTGSSESPERAGGDSEVVERSAERPPVTGASSGQLEDARELVEEATGSFRKTGDKWRLAIALRELAEIAELGGDSEGARRLRHESEEARRELGRLQTSSGTLAVHE